MRKKRRRKRRRWSRSEWIESYIYKYHRHKPKQRKKRRREKEGRNERRRRRRRSSARVVSLSPMGLEETRRREKAKRRRWRKTTLELVHSCMSPSCLSLSLSPRWRPKKKKEKRRDLLNFFIIFYGTPRKREAPLFFIIIILAQTVVHSVRWAHLYFFFKGGTGRKRNRGEVMKHIFVHFYFAVRVPTRRRRIKRKPVPVRHWATGFSLSLFTNLRL